MKLAVGPLTTGTYVVHAVDHHGKYFGHKGADGTKVGVIQDKEHEAIKWKIEQVGENRFKAKNNFTNAMLSVNPVDQQTIEMTEEEIEWMVEPTDVDGEYIGYPAQFQNKSVFAAATMTSDEVTVKLVPRSEMTRFNVYHVDDD